MRAVFNGVKVNYWTPENPTGNFPAAHNQWCPRNGKYSPSGCLLCAFTEYNDRIYLAEDMACKSTLEQCQVLLYRTKPVNIDRL